MNKQKWILCIAALVLIGGAGTFLAYLQGHQRLGHPAVKTTASADSHRLQVELPLQALDYTSEPVEISKSVLDVLPPDTSFGHRHYQAADGFQTDINVVLMGSDRTSLHKPQICLSGTGWNIDRTDKETVRMERPLAYDLPVTKLILSEEKPGSFKGAKGVCNAGLISPTSPPVLREMSKRHSNA